MERSKAAKIILSPKARELERLKAAMIPVTGVREKRVARLKQMIRNGTYPMDSRRAAGGILKQALLIRLLA